MSRAPSILAAIALCLAGAPAPAPAETPKAAHLAGTRDLYLLLIRQARDDGRPRAALAYLADFDRRHPGDGDAHMLRINCLLDLGQTDAAEAALAALPVSGASDAVHGHVLAARGDWTRAAARYRGALAAMPADPLTANALGYAQLRAGHLDEAVETLRGAADLAPMNAVIRNNLLLALTLTGKGAEADAKLHAVTDPAARADLKRVIVGQAMRLAAMPAPFREGD
jgi:Flp pilus assembly protein TadD